MAPHCRYTIDEWQTKRVKKESGTTLQPVWPTADAKTCTVKRLGCEREGDKNETYTVHFLDDDGGAHHCELSQSRWTGFEAGAKLDVSFGMMGGIKCGSLP